MSTDMSDEEREYWQGFGRAMARRMDSIILKTFLETGARLEEVESLESQWDRS